MRIWHEELIPRLCRQHLLAVWREGLGCWAILTQDKKGYRNHPAVLEWEDDLCGLWGTLYDIRKEMLQRGYKPKKLPEIRHACKNNLCRYDINKEWQTLEEQVEVLRGKGCKCDLSSFN